MTPARDLALEALLALDRGGPSVREALDAVRPRAADAREAAFLTEVVHATLRRQGTLDHLLDGAGTLPAARLDPVVRAAARLALAQALFLDRVPAHAAVDHAVGAVRERTNARLAGYANGVLRNVLRSVEGRAAGPEDPRRDVPRPGAPSVRMRRAVFPDPESDAAGNLAARLSHPRFLVERWLARFGAEATRAALEAGIARPAPPGPAAARLAALVGDGADAAVTVRTAAEAAALPAGSVAVLVVDAPSSGTGVLARRPEVRARLRAGDAPAFAAIQRDLLRRAADAVAPGGRLVYAVGSVEPEETEEVVGAVLAEAAGWRRGEGFLVLPSPEAGGGFGAVLLRS